MLSVVIKKVNLVFDQFVGILLHFSNSSYRGYGKSKMAACDLQMLTAGNTAVFLCLAGYHYTKLYLLSVCARHDLFLPAAYQLRAE